MEVARMKISETESNWDLDRLTEAEFEINNVPVNGIMSLVLPWYPSIKIFLIFVAFKFELGQELISTSEKF